MRSTLSAVWLLAVLHAGVAAAAAAAAAPATLPAPVSPAAPTQDWRVTVREFAAKHFKNPAWGYSHCVRDYALAVELAAADHVMLDDDVLYAAAYLHDIAAFAPWEDTKVDHSDVGARVVDTVLKGTGFPMAKIDGVRAAIRTHMYYRDPQAPEALYLHDADALDWLGAIGVARVMALVDPNGGSRSRAKTDAAMAQNVKQVRRRVLPPAGPARVPERKAELEKFLADLRRETEDLRTL